LEELISKYNKSCHRLCLPTFDRWLVHRPWEWLWNFVWVTKKTVWWS